ncbi:App1 family protein [Virgifigura deserti]|uniref:App1 family protein n=1 Tax=Virgifigura deserti TaxID=2268457 RepID=UPI003CCC2227
MQRMANRVRAVRKVLRLLGRSDNAAGGQNGVVLQPYRGYGSAHEVFLIGRVFKQPGTSPTGHRGTLRHAAIDAGRRLLRRGIADATLVVRFYGTEQRVTTDRDGYFRIHLRPAQSSPTDRLWHSIALELMSPVAIVAEGALFIPPGTCRYVVISDIDDTVMYTGVVRKLEMLWRLFMQEARNRAAFPGIAAFLQALHRGVSGTEGNPMLYVSRAPWSLYEVLDEFFNLHGIPIGPVLFLREWGLTLQSPLPRRAKGHKLELVRNMLALYDDLPFVLIGDSGQRDPEIYSQIVREHPGRVAAIYIRNVSRNPERRRAIEALAVEVVNAGSTLLLASDSLAMARHATEHGLIAPEALSAVAEERKVQPDEPAPKPTCELIRPTPRETREVVQRGELTDVLDEKSDGDAPPNVVVEPEDEKGR